MTEDSYSADPNEPKGSKSVLFENRIWLSTDEAARYLGKSRNAIWILLSRGELIKRKWKRRLYFKKCELDRLLETSLQ